MNYISSEHEWEQKFLALTLRNALKGIIVPKRVRRNSEIYKSEHFSVKEIFKRTQHNGTTLQLKGTREW